MNQLLPLAGVSLVVVLAVWMVSGRSQHPLLDGASAPAGSSSVIEADAPMGPPPAAPAGFDVRYGAFSPQKDLPTLPELAVEDFAAADDPGLLRERDEELPFEESFGESEGLSDAPFEGPRKGR